ncbi:MAG: glycogen synthase [Parachlamydiaceae bacterium]
MRILFMASEAFPIIKTGGLADVAGSLPLALKKQDIDVRLFMPAYRGAKDLVRKKQKPIYFGNPLGNTECWVIPAKHPTEDLDIFLLDAPDAFDRDGGPYLDNQGTDWPDNDLRFALFSRIGALLGLGGDMIGFRPDLIHCNDWQTGLTPALLHQWGGKNIPSLDTIHNVQYQGNFLAWNRERLGISSEQFSVYGLEFHGQISYMKAGIWFSNHLSTVSPTYATEITTPEFGMGLDGLISSRSDQLTGILNGIDTEKWDS